MSDDTFAPIGAHLSADLQGLAGSIEAGAPSFPPEVGFLRVEDLVPYARNARTHDAANVAQLRGSIAEFGWTNPILADETGIVAGHGRLLAARAIYDAGERIRLPAGGLVADGCVPVIDVSGWSEAKRRAYILLDNKSALNSGWDVELLRVEMDEIEASGIDLELTGFGASEIEAIRGGLADVDLSADGDESASGGEGETLSFGGTKVPVSGDEVAKLTLLLGRYVEEHGVSHGFGHWLCEGRDAA